MVGNNNKIYALKSFSLVYGVNSKKVKTLCQQVGLNPANRELKFKKNHHGLITKKFLAETYDQNLKVQIRKNIKFLTQIRTYRGLRHAVKLPTRGQRTKTNAKTKKRFKI